MKQTRAFLLRQERERRGWSRSYVAEQVEVDIITVGRWERGERMPHPLYRQKLCALFEMDAQALGLFSESSQGSDNVAVAADPSLQTPSTDEASTRAASLVLRRRTLLIGLGGLGVTAL